VRSDDCFWDLNNGICLRDDLTGGNGNTRECRLLERNDCRRTDGCEWDADSNPPRCIVDRNINNNNNNNNNKNVKTLCGGLEKKKCKRNASCEWNKNKCLVDKTVAVSSVNGRVGYAESLVKIQPNAASGTVATKISEILGCVLVAMWYQWY